jgi:hypothetical protein
MDVPDAEKLMKDANDDLQAIPRRAGRVQPSEIFANVHERTVKISCLVGFLLFDRLAGECLAHRTWPG